MNKCRKGQVAAAHRVTGRHNSRDTTQAVLNVDGTGSSTTGRGRVGGGWPEGGAGRPASAWVSGWNLLCLSIFLLLEEGQGRKLRRGHSP